MHTSKLDNPAWYSLTETHHPFSAGFGNALFYQPAFCPFGGFMGEEEITNAMNKYAELVPDFFIIGAKPAYEGPLRLKKELVCHQMVRENKIDLTIDKEILKLNSGTTADLFNLVNAVQPGYFKNRTAELGSYYGIHINGELAAVCGERMKMESYTEVSAVVTHPDHVRKGLAGMLVACTCNHIFEENRIPYLHVAETNWAAIQLYEKLGFKTRRKISFWNFAIY